MSSTRLPGKVTKSLFGKPMLLQLITRLKRAKQLDDIVVATSDQTDDEAIVTVCKQNKVKVFTGSLDDVLARFYHCALTHNAANILRVTADCPLLDPYLIDDAFDQHQKANCDYTSNCTKRTYPDGQDIEIFTFESLEQAFHKAKKPSEREHVTPYIRESGLFSSHHLMLDEDYSELRMSVDHPQDFEFVEKVYQALMPQKPEFTLADIVELLKQQPEFLSINQHIEFNEGYAKSLAADKQAGF